ncbi:MAG: hypothetical protein RIB98_19590 [Acidimicrobiales bacterium]
MSARHPNPQRLQRWLDTGEPRRVSNHIEGCLRCQEQLEKLSELDEEMVADLQAATTPPDDLRERTHGGMDVRLRNEAAFGAFLDLFAIGWDVARSILDPELTEGDDPHGAAPAADDADGDLS